ncbi:hypothetical protein V2J09_015724 [Rumex salicifolius]
MGSGNRGGFVVDKGEATDCDFGLGLKMMMMGNHNHHSHNNDESGTKFVGFSGDQCTGSPGGYSGGSTGVSGGGIGNFGAMFSSNNQDSTPITNSSTTSMYGGVGGGASSVQRSSQSTSLGFDPSSFKSWGGFLMGGGGDMTRVFTASQRQELERQTLIYKHMAASMPVPPELLVHMSSKYPSQLPLPSYQSNDHGNSSGRSGFDLRYAVGSRDAEPWRCRRTDGKKWRCSRDVAPDQKYCERHSHKGRPSRSRKHVESSSASSSSSTSSSISNARINNNNNINNRTFMQSSAVNPANNINMKPSFLYHPSHSQSMFMSQHHENPSQNSHSRLPEWFMKREAHHHDQSTASPFFPHTELDQFTPTHSRATHNPFMGNSQPQSPTTLPRQFLDAWSIGPKPDGIVEITGKPTTDSGLLTLSMAGGSGSSGAHNSEEAAAQLGMGLDVGGGERYSWMGSSGPGGPLAEALCLGIVGQDATDGSGGSQHGHGESGQGLGFNK